MSFIYLILFSMAFFIYLVNKFNRLIIKLITMDLLYSKILDRLSEIPDLAWIDIDSGQLDWPGENYPLLFPCALIDFPSVEWQDAGNRLQHGNVSVQVKIALNVYQDANNKTPEYIRNRALEYLKLINTVFAKLQGFDGDHFNRLTRIQTTTEKREDGLKVFTLLFLTNIRDANACPEMIQKENITLKINT